MNDQIKFTEEYYIQRGKAVFWRTMTWCLIIIIVFILWLYEK